MNAESLILNRNFQKLAAAPSLIMGGLKAMRPASNVGASEMLSQRLRAPEVPPAKRSFLSDSAAATANKVLKAGLSAYKTKGKYTDNMGNAMPGKYKGLSFKGTF